MGIEGEIRRKTMTSVYRGVYGNPQNDEAGKQNEKNTHHPTKQITLI
jgi:hypothetical protein